MTDQRPSPRPYPVAAGDVPASPATGLRIGYVGAAFTLAGLVLTVYALTSSTWFENFGSTSANFGFGDLHDQLHTLPGPAVIPQLYFGWLAWTLCAAGTVVALAATIATPAAPALRVFGSVFGAAGVALTLLSIKLTTGVPPLSEYLKHVSSGFYLASVGFLAIAIGATIGPWRPVRGRPVS